MALLIFIPVFCHHIAGDAYLHEFLAVPFYRMTSSGPYLNIFCDEMKFDEMRVVVLDVIGFFCCLFSFNIKVYIKL
jgi:hypothetical protein